MSLPEIPGYRIGSLIGKGACGSVYMARHDSGSLVSVKLLKEGACNPGLIANRINRLYKSAPPKAAVPLIAHSLEREPYLLIGTLMADRVVQDVGERYIPRTLQLQLGDFLGERHSWMLVRRLAQVLAEFHRRRVAHGNLKPGNIFLDTEGEILLSDYAQGLMPDIAELPYTDALLYAPPEQLMHPGGYLEGAGYGWDVYSFGTLAYRLLTGRFPRCHETFEQVAPAPGEHHRRGVEADCERIAKKLEGTSIADWMGIAPTREEEEGRLVIERCLDLDPWKRYPDMREVLRALEEIALSRQNRLTAEADAERVVVIERKRNGWRTAAGVGIAACLALGGVVVLQMLSEDPPAVAESKGKPEAPPSKPETTIDPAELDELRRAAELAKSEKDYIERATEGLRARYGEMAEDLATAFSMSDQLVSWAVERGAENLPTLEGRNGRLAVLETNLAKLLKKAESQEAVQRHAWRIKLALAEVALAADKPKIARDRMKEVIREAVADDEETLMRLARARVLVCLLGSKDEESGLLPEELAATETALLSLPAENRETRRLKSALQVAQARVNLKAGDSAGALENYRVAFQSMTELCEEQPSLVALRLWRARGYSEAARAAQGEGVADAAILLREQAAVELMEMLEVQPDRAEVQVELSHALGAIAESALEAGEIDRAAELSARSLKLLEGALVHPQEREDALVQLATQKSVLAACKAGTGQGKEAVTLVHDGIAHVNGALKRDPRDPRARYRLAILTWQEAGLRASDGGYPEALRLGLDARTVLHNLIQENVQYPAQREIKRSLAYLASDLGHAAQLAGRDGDAIKFFRESVGSWRALAETGGEKLNPEIQEGYDWAQMRLRELGVMTSLPPKRR